MKKLLASALSIIMSASLITGCGTAEKIAVSPENNDKNDKLKVVTTIFPEYDWVSRIAGDNADVTMLLDKGVDLHSYQPTADDIIKISNCDMFIYVGGESDEWVENALKEAVNENMVVINLLDTLGDSAKEEELAEGMEHEHDEEDEYNDEHGEEEIEYDEHVWLSLKNAIFFCGHISDKLCEMDPENREFYTSNSESYTEKLRELDKQYEDAVNSSENKTLLFGDRFPFRYLVDDYGLSYFAAFAGCSAETEASFETIVFLAEKTDELGLNSILHIESSDGSIAETIKKNTKSKNQKILTINSMQSVTSKDVETGLTYLSIMENNLDILKEALR